MTGEGRENDDGSTNVEIVDVEVEEVEVKQDNLEHVDEQEAAVVEEEESPLTVGDLMDGAKGVLDNVTSTAKRIVDRGRYRKVRIKRKGKAVLPDIPLAAVAAVEVASLYGAGIARVLAANVGAKFLFDVEMVNEADKYFNTGREALLEGDLERAEAALLKALRIDDTHAGAYLQLGVLYRLKGDPEKAGPLLERARALDETGEIGKKAHEILRSISQQS